MQAREFSLGIRFNDFTEVGTSFRFKHPQFLNSIINEALTAMFRDIMPPQGRLSGKSASRCITWSDSTLIPHCGAGRPILPISPTVVT